MPFMEPQIMLDDWYKIDGPMCTEWIPADLTGDLSFESMPDETTPVPAELADYCENTEYNILERVTGYGARLSAPGYMDRTDWRVFDTEREATEYLQETYDLDENLEPIIEEI